MARDNSQDTEGATTNKSGGKTKDGVTNGKKSTTDNGDSGAVARKHRASQQFIKDKAEEKGLRLSNISETTDHDLQEKLQSLGTKQGSTIEDVVKFAEDTITEYRALSEHHQELQETYNEAVRYSRNADELHNSDSAQLARLTELLEQTQVELEDLQAEMTAMEQDKEDTKPVIPHSRVSKSLPDPQPLTDGKNPGVADWVMDMRQKLKGNADHYPTLELQIAYVSMSCHGKAKDYIRTRLEPDAKLPFTDVEQIFNVLLQALGKSNAAKRAAAQEEWKNCYQNKKKFPTFWADVQRLAALLGYSEEMMLDHTKSNMSLPLQKATVNEMTTDLMSFVDICIQVDARLDIINKAEERMSSAIKGITIPTGQNNSNRFRQGNTNSGRQRPTAHSTPRTDQPHKCYICADTGHRAAECPQWVKEFWKDPKILAARAARGLKERTQRTQVNAVEVETAPENPNSEADEDSENE